VSKGRGTKRASSSFRFRWWWLVVAGIVVSGVLFVSRKQVRRGFRWIEKRYFAHIGDKGPLQRVQAGVWKKEQPGFWTRSMLFKRKRHWSRVRLRLVRVDPRQFRVSLWWHRKPRRIKWILKKTGALAAINAGLFAPSYKPLGYLKVGKKVIHKRQHRRYVDGVFFLRGGRYQMATGRSWKSSMSVDWAFQSAPLLVANGQRRRLPTKSWKVDRRSAVCIVRQKRIVLMATSGLINGLSFYELSLLMAMSVKRGGLGCHWGLNLDGGSSAQWAVKTRGGLQVTAGIPVPSFLLIHPKK
jgi:uncharacterized protein YigE (DUF2233 family)